MNKQVLYKNKCRLDFETVDSLLTKYTPEELNGKRIIAIQANKFVCSGKILTIKDNFMLFYNYSDDKYESIKYLYSLENVSEADPDKYDYDEYKESIKKAVDAYKAVKPLYTNIGIDYVALVDDFEIVIDAKDEPFEKNVLNLLTYQKDIDYYSRGEILCIQKGGKLNEVQTMSIYPDNINKHFIEYQAFDFFYDMEYLNFYFNIEIYHNNTKVDLY